MTRAKVKDLIQNLAQDNAKIPSNILNAVGNIRLSQLMDQGHWNFKELDKELIPWSEDKMPEKTGT